MKTSRLIIAEEGERQLVKLANQSILTGNGIDTIQTCIIKTTRDDVILVKGNN